MADYLGTATVLWSIPFGSRRVAFVKLSITNYNSTGIPFSPHQVGLAYIDAVFLGAPTSLDDGEAPVAIVYDPVKKICLLYKGADQPVSNNVNIKSAIGDLTLLVIGS
jgi:hypothetical protein